MAKRIIDNGFNDTRRAITAFGNQGSVPVVNAATRQHESTSEQRGLGLGFWPTSWVAVVRNRITIAHGGHGYKPCADRAGYWY